MTMAMPAGLEEMKMGDHEKGGVRTGLQMEREKATSIMVSRIDNGFSQA